MYSLHTACGNNNIALNGVISHVYAICVVVLTMQNVLTYMRSPHDYDLLLYNIIGGVRSSRKGVLRHMGYNRWYMLCPYMYKYVYHYTGGGMCIFLYAVNMYTNDTRHVNVNNTYTPKRVGILTYLNCVYTFIVVLCQPRY